MGLLSKFLPDEHNRRLLPGFLAFCLAAIGALLGFVATEFEIAWLGKLAFMIVAVAVVWGFIFVLTGWVKAIPEVLKAFSKNPVDHDSTKNRSD